GTSTEPCSEVEAADDDPLSREMPSPPLPPRRPIVRPRHSLLEGEVVVVVDGSFTGLVTGRPTRSRQSTPPPLVARGCARSALLDGRFDSLRRQVVSAPPPLRLIVPPCFTSLRTRPPLSCGTRPSSVPLVPGAGTPEGEPTGAASEEPPPTGAMGRSPAYVRATRSRMVVESSGSRRKNGVISAATPEASLPVPRPIPRREITPTAAVGSLSSSRVKRAGALETVAKPPSPPRSRRPRTISVLIAA